MLDLGVDGGRSLVDIPVIGPCEAVFHIAAQLGDRFGVICYHQTVIPRQITQTRMLRHGELDRRAARVRLQAQGDRRQQGRDEHNFIAAGRS